MGLLFQYLIAREKGKLITLIFKDRLYIHRKIPVL